jgi:hypothetical protein
MTDERIAEYIAKAEECRVEARRAAHADERVAWLRMAEEWLLLSRGIHQNADEDARQKTRVDGHTQPVHSNIVTR